MNEELSFLHNGRTYRCWVASVNVSAAPPPTVSSNAFWFAEVDNRQYLVFEASYDDLKTPAQQMALERHVVATVAKQEPRPPTL